MTGTAPTAPEIDTTPAATRVLARALDVPPLLGATRLVCLDGPAGSGKSTLARGVVAVAREAGLSTVLVGCDDVLHGWTGLRGLGADLDRDVVRPLAEGRPAGYRRWDWVADAYAEWVVVPAVDLLVLEGVGSGSPLFGDLVSVLVWVEAPSDLRLERGLARDGEQMREHWLRWRVEEDALFATDRTRERADLHYDGSSGTVTWSRGTGSRGSGFA